MLSSPPRNDEIEVSLFGPGYGECILLHIGGSQWIIVDSCIDLNSRKPAALQYLTDIGVDPSKDVKLVIATHWHDDHIRGLGEIVSYCENAKFVCSDALGSKNFLRLVEVYTNHFSSKNEPGAYEFYKIFNTLQNRSSTPKLASVDRHLWCNKKSSYSPDILCSVYALSPSDKELLKSKLSIANLLPEEHQPKTRLASPKPNNSAVVLLIEVGKIQILLGADLEETSDAETGWSVIVDSTTRPRGQAFIYKIPHHGSKNGDFQSIWDNLLLKSPFALITPFTRGPKPLPEESVVRQICKRTENAYISIKQPSKKLKIREPLVKKMIKRTVKQIKVVEHSTGHVRLRGEPKASHSSWQVHLFNGACNLNSYF